MPDIKFSIRSDGFSDIRCPFVVISVSGYPAHCITCPVEHQSPISSPALKFFFQFRVSDPGGFSSNPNGTFEKKNRIRINPSKKKRIRNRPSKKNRIRILPNFCLGNPLSLFLQTLKSIKLIFLLMMKMTQM